MKFSGSFPAGKEEEPALLSWSPCQNEGLSGGPHSQLPPPSGRWVGREPRSLALLPTDAVSWVSVRRKRMLQYFPITSF